jgi:hypothetical protein
MNTLLLYWCSYERNMRKNEILSMSGIISCIRYLTTIISRNHIRFRMTLLAHETN